METIPCTCKGDNENCRWCDGTGYRASRTVEDVRKESIRDRQINSRRDDKSLISSVEKNKSIENSNFQKIKKHSKKKSGYQLIRCIRCDKFFSSSLLHQCSLPTHQIPKNSNQPRFTASSGKKQRELHPRHSNESIVTMPEKIRYVVRRMAPSFIEVNLKHCQFCNDQPMVRLRNHIMNHHPEKKDEIIEIQEIQSDKPYVCKLCNEAFNKRKQAIEHLCVRHSDHLLHFAVKSEIEGKMIDIIRQSSGKKSKKTRVGKIDVLESAMKATIRGLYEKGVLHAVRGNEQAMDAKRNWSGFFRDGSQFEPYGNEKAVDAKRNWGGSFRDGGQFGSHSCHDDYDEEGNP